MVRLSMGCPSPKDEAAMVLNRQGGNPLHELTPLMTREDLTAMQDTVEETYLSDSVVNYIVALISATRGSADILRAQAPGRPWPSPPCKVGGTAFGGGIT